MADTTISLWKYIHTRVSLFNFIWWANNIMANNISMPVASTSFLSVWSFDLRKVSDITCLQSINTLTFNKSIKSPKILSWYYYKLLIREGYVSWLWSWNWLEWARISQEGDRSSDISAVWEMRNAKLCLYFSCLAWILCTRRRDLTKLTS